MATVPVTRPYLERIARLAPETTAEVAPYVPQPIPDGEPFAMAKFHEFNGSSATVFRRH